MLPDARIAIMSGRLDERDTEEWGALGIRAALSKPFTSQRLLETLRTMLAQVRDS